jgi:inner membrane transporter RhtA
VSRVGAGAPGGAAPGTAPVAGPEAAPARAGAPDVGLILLAIASVQVSAAVATEMFDDAGPLGATLVRTALAAAVLLVAVRPAVRSLTPRTVRAVLPYGLALGVMNASFYLGLDRVHLGTAVAIEFLGPLTVGALFARRPRDRWWVVLAAAGVLALTRPWSDAHADPVGVLWLLVAAASWGAYIPLGARAAAELPGLQPIALAMVVAMLVALVPGVLQGGGDLVSGHVLLVGTVAAVAGSAVPYSLEQLALRRVPPGVFGVLMALEPGVAALAGLLILGQGLPALSILGLALVVVAGVGVTRAGPAAATAVAEPPRAPGRGPAG